MQIHACAQLQMLLFTVVSIDRLLCMQCSSDDVCKILLI